MPSRVSSTRNRTPTWKTWLLQEYARYWYGLGVILVFVFGDAELARVGGPFGAIQIVGLFLLSIAVAAGGLAGYVALWRRDTEAAQWMLRALKRLRPAPVSSTKSQAWTATPDGDPETEVREGRA